MKKGKNAKYGLEIRENVQNMDLDVMGIAETWLLPGEKIDVDGYKIDG